MSIFKEILDGRPDFIEVYNQFSLFLQKSVAEIISDKLDTPIDPNTLPAVLFIDNERTRAQLADLKAWTYPATTLQRKTLLGHEVVGIQLHPNLISQRAKDIIENLREDEIRGYIEKHGIDELQMAQYVLDRSASQLIIEWLLYDTPDIDPLDLFTEAYDRALDDRDR